MNEITFSIIVPVYLVEEYIHRCVESLIQQTYNSIEILLIDDGSPDSCPRICDEYAKADPRIKVIHKTNGGLSDARNTGISQAKGKYLIFVDSDDYIDIDSCERIKKYADMNVDIIICDAKTEGGICNLDHINYYNQTTGLDWLKRSALEKKDPMAACLNVYKTSFLIDNSIKFKKGILHEDEQFTPRAFIAANKVIYSGEYFYHYVIRDNSITTKKDKRKNLADLYDTCVELSSIYCKIVDNKASKILRDGLVLRYLYLFAVCNAYNYGNEYIHKKFVINNSFKIKTIIREILFVISPKLYCKIINRLRGRI